MDSFICSICFVSSYSGLPTRAELPLTKQLYAKMCQDDNVVDSSTKKKNPCMCSFLRSRGSGRTDLKSLRGVETPCIDGVAATGDDLSYPCHNVNL
jgi:hypothetical protein